VIVEDVSVQVISAARREWIHPFTHPDPGRGHHARPRRGSACRHLTRSVSIGLGTSGERRRFDPVIRGALCHQRRAPTEQRRWGGRRPLQRGGQLGGRSPQRRRLRSQPPTLLASGAGTLQRRAAV